MDAARHPALLLADTISSLGSIDFRMDEWNVDICVSGSQKGFMMPAGLAAGLTVEEFTALIEYLVTLKSIGG